jgi:hypothetical protein
VTGLSYTVRLDTAAPDLGLPRAEGMTTSEIYHGGPESGRYSLHAHLAHHDGVVYAAWSNHPVDEDAPGQRVLLARSDDLGSTWSEFVEAIPPIDRVSNADEDGHGRRTMCANGFATVDGRLYVIAEAWQHGGNYRLPDMGLGRLAREVVPEFGEPFWLGPAPSPLAGIPDHPSGAPALVARTLEEFTRPEHFPAWDFTGFTSDFELSTGEWMCEPTSSWRTADGTWWRLFRDFRKSHRDYVSTSPDGVVWSAPEPTTIPDASARTSIVQLDSGAVIALSNPRTGDTGDHAGRDPLVATVALDGLDFSHATVLAQGARPQRHDGRWKARGFHYPHAIVVGDQLLVVYAVNKEDIEVVRVPVAALLPTSA